ncbi:hypothetical protein PDTK01_27000 [Phycicoccus sp. DTK01]|nr:hypothetical protein PDTK01_27000 [Phycicoccus sp. DTK01]
MSRPGGVVREAALRGSRDPALRGASRPDGGRRRAGGGRDDRLLLELVAEPGETVADDVHPLHRVGELDLEACHVVPVRHAPKTPGGARRGA